MVDELDEIYGEVFDYAMEGPGGHVIPNDVRESLDDDDFGIPEERKYPLRVPGNKKLTEELVQKAVQMYHYLPGKSGKREILAKNIVKMIKQENLSIKVDPKNQMFKYVDYNTLPEKNRKVSEK